VHLEFQIICIRLFAAMFCGALLGIERERTEHAAGLRTHALVCVSSCLLMIVSAFGFTDAIQQGASQLDPSRVAAQVVSGIGFLGAGVIMFRQNSVSGLNTAASIWSSAAIGLACGGGLFSAALLTVFILLMVQTVWRKFEHRFFFHSSTVTLTVRKHCIQDIEKVMHESGVRLKSLSMIVKGQDFTGPDDRREIKLVLENAPQKSAVLFIEKLHLIDGVDKLEYEESGAKMVKAGEHAHRGSEESGAP
jgi:putative Mg2+ transporter-C (MgtC) family protein